MAISNAAVPLTTPSAIYTSTNNTAVTNVYFCNYGGSSVTVDVYLVPNGGSAANTNIIYKTISIPAANTFVMDTEKLILGNGDSLQASASAATSVTATISYLSI